MNPITRSTIRADGLTVGQAMDRDAAELRKLGINAPDGAPTLDERKEAFIEQARKVVLDALDDMMKDANDGPKDGELPDLFAAVDGIAARMFYKREGMIP